MSLTFGSVPSVMRREARSTQPCAAAWRAIVSPSGKPRRQVSLKAETSGSPSWAVAAAGSAAVNRAAVTAGEAAAAGFVEGGDERLAFLGRRRRGQCSREQGRRQRRQSITLHVTFP